MRPRLLIVFITNLPLHAVSLALSSAAVALATMAHDVNGLSDDLLKWAKQTPIKGE